MEGAGAGELLPAMDVGHISGTALGTEQQLSPSPVLRDPDRPERGKRAARLLQNIPWARLVQALLMRSIILLQKNCVWGIRHIRSPPGCGRAGSLRSCPARRGRAS